MAKASRLRLGATTSLFAMLAGSALAREGSLAVTFGDGWSFGALEVMQIAIFTGAMGSALLSAIWLIRERARIAADNLDLRGRLTEVSEALKRAEALINLKDQRLLVWTREQRRPELFGSLPPESGAPEDRAGFLAFGRWLSPRSAASLESALQALRERAEPFDLVIETQIGALLEVQGRMSGVYPSVRFLALSALRADHARLRLDHQRLAAENARLKQLLDAIDIPVWLRDREGRLQWVNRAYAEAVDAPDAAAAVDGQRELLGAQALAAIAARRHDLPVVRERVSTVVGGDRRIYTIVDVETADGSAGIALDRSEIEALREEQARTLRSHAETLDQLTTAVAIFDHTQKLRFFNQAFQKLWDLEAAFLESAPDHALLLDRLRSEGRLPEDPEWRKWKERILSAYLSPEPTEFSWHLPDGRTIRVVANPNPKGGVTWVFENLTERIDLESRYNAAVRVQTETLDNLVEGVIVFGPDGKLRLVNPAFFHLWGIDPSLVRPGAHISAVRAVCDPLARKSHWRDFVAAVTGFDEERRDRHGQVELTNGRVLHYGLIHLPNSLVMLTFVDVTDSVNVERALKEKNEALERADQLKNDFVQHVSYELRSPLTNIIGFTELLLMPETGPLNPTQRDYVDHISSSSSVLMTIVNDILDLATVDAGIMELDIGDVVVEEAVKAVVERTEGRIREHGIRLEIDLQRAPHSFRADASRIAQILFNLLSNAANYAPDHGVIRLACREEGDEVVFSVHDDGPGMPPEAFETVFRRFETRGNGGRRRGAGLGLSIVKSFVELHGGSVAIDSASGRGTTVICRFPRDARRMMAAE
jgi:signal transduction histidine kinase